MSATPPRSLDEIVEHLKVELSKHADYERGRVAAAADAAIQRIQAAEAAARPQAAQPSRPARSAFPVTESDDLRAPRRFERSVDPPPAEDVPAGALLLARRMADEGHTRDEVADFLAENFRRIDVPSAVDHAFQDAHAAH